MNFNLPQTCLQAILNTSNDIYILVEINTLRLLAFNPSFEQLGFEDVILDANIHLHQQPFYQSFSGLDEVISIQLRLLKNGNNPSLFAYLPIGSVTLKTGLKNNYSVFAKLVHYLEDDNAALVQVCINDYATFSAHDAEQNLERRDALLKATSRAAQELLSENQQFDITINTVLGILGNATNVDRVYVWSIHNAPDPEEDDRLYTSQLYEWSEGAEPQQGLELVTNMLVDEGIPTWIGTFLEGKCVNSLVKNMPQAERDVLEPQGIISILTAPIIFHGHLWGFIGFDNCHSEYTWSASEEDILRTAGTLISTAIHSKRTNQALYEAQERFYSVEEATGDIIWSVDRNHNIDYISPRLYAVLQYSPNSVLGKPFSSLFLDPNEFQYTATPENYIMRDFELRARCKDGRIKWLRSSCKYTFDDEGNMLHGFGSSSDITRMHNTQEALQNANHELEEAIKIANALVESANTANTIKGNFLANMSHEIRTPMNAIIGIIHLLKHTELSQKQSEYIEKIDVSSDSLLNIINDILDFAKIQDGNMIIEKSNLNIKNIMSDIEQTALQWAEEKNIDFIVNIESEVNDNYVGDAVRLNQVLTSLTTNAIKFTHSGSVSVNVGIKSENNESALLEFSVQDTGIGIAQEDMDNLFERFTQADISSTRRYGGIGLGLALCRNLTVLMGGDIWCTSELGKGSTFYFTCRLEKDQLNIQNVQDIEKQVNIIAAFPNHKHFNKLESLFASYKNVHLHFAKSMLDINGHFLFDQLPDVLIMHENFNEVSLVNDVLQDNSDYFNDIPVIFFAKKKDEQIPAHYTVIDSLTASVLHDTLVDLIGPFSNSKHDTHNENSDELLRSRHHGKKVLLVEDNEINQIIAQAVLEEVGLNVTVANNGKEGCELMHQSSFDIVVMDIQMPVMDGLSATKKIREQSEFDHIPIIAMTAHAMEEDREKSLSAGMNDHTVKPLDAPELFKVLLHWLDVSHENRI